MWLPQVYSPVPNYIIKMREPFDNNIFNSLLFWWIHVISIQNKTVSITLTLLLTYLAILIMGIIVFHCNDWVLVSVLLPIHPMLIMSDHSLHETRIIIGTAVYHVWCRQAEILSAHLVKKQCGYTFFGHSTFFQIICLYHMCKTTANLNFLDGQLMVYSQTVQFVNAIRISVFDSLLMWWSLSTEIRLF